MSRVMTVTHGGRLYEGFYYYNRYLSNWCYKEMVNGGNNNSNNNNNNNNKNNNNNNEAK